MRQRRNGLPCPRAPALEDSAVILYVLDRTLTVLPSLMMPWATPHPTLLCLKRGPALSTSRTRTSQEEAGIGSSHKGAGLALDSCCCQLALQLHKEAQQQTP